MKYKENTGKYMAIYENIRKYKKKYNKIYQKYNKI